MKFKIFSAIIILIGIAIVAVFKQSEAQQSAPPAQQEQRPAEDASSQFKF